MRRLVFLDRTHINRDDFTLLNSIDQGLRIHWVEVRDRFEEPASELFNLSQTIFCQDTERPEKVADQGVRQRIHHKTALLLRSYQSRRLQHLKVLGGVREAHLGFASQNLDRPVRLAKQVQ